jgi:chromosome segregation ATPase
VTGEFAQLRQIWTGEIARLTLRVEQLEQAAKERSRRIETLETAVVQLEAENDELRTVVADLGGNPPPRRIRLADLGLTFTQLRSEGSE